MARETNHPAVVRHISKGHITIAPGEGYSVVLFNLHDGNVEAIVTSDDGLDTHRLLIAGPAPDQNMTIETHKPTGITNILYEKMFDARQI